MAIVPAATEYTVTVVLAPECTELAAPPEWRAAARPMECMVAVPVATEYTVPVVLALECMVAVPVATEYTVPVVLALECMVPAPMEWRAIVPVATDCTVAVVPALECMAAVVRELMVSVAAPECRAAARLMDYMVAVPVATECTEPAAPTECMVPVALPECTVLAPATECRVLAARASEYTPLAPPEWKALALATDCTALVPAGTGVFGTSGSGTAVYGSGVTYGVQGNGATGVYGNGTAYGVQASGGSGIGVYGTGATYAGYFSGDVYISGKVGIGMTPVAQLDLSTDSARKLTTTLWSTGSDIRIKNQVETINDALDIIGKVRPVKFHYTADYIAKHPSIVDTEYYNFIAQEYQQVFPNSVTEIDGLLYLNTSNMIPYAIAGIQELNLNLEGIAGTITPLANSASESFVTAFFKNIFAKITIWLADAGNGIAKVFTGEIDTKSLCVSDDTGAKTCVNKMQLDALLAGAGGSGNIVNNTGGFTPTPAPTPAPTPTPIPTPNPSPTPTPTPTSDTTPPVITLNGAETITLNVGDAYSELGATVTDDIDTSVAIIISGTVDAAIAGTYTIHYNASDTAGNHAIEVTRTVTVNTVSPSTPTPAPTPTTSPVPDTTPPPAPVTPTPTLITTTPPPVPTS